MFKENNARCSGDNPPLNEALSNGKASALESYMFWTASARRAARAKEEQERAPASMQYGTDRSGKRKKPLLVLMELRPAFEGFAGIPQETRLLFAAFRQLENTVETVGLINHPNRR